MIKIFGKEFENDPVHTDGKWYFWDESESIEYGPFDTEEIARKELQTYCESLEPLNKNEIADDIECARDWIWRGQVTDIEVKNCIKELNVLIKKLREKK